MYGFEVGMGRILFVLPLFVQIALAQQPSAGSDSDREIIQQLLERVKQLETEVRELKGEHADKTASNPDPAAKPASSETQARQAPVSSSQAQSMAAMGAEPTSSFGHMQFRGFSDISYHASDLKGDTNSFALGQFNLFITSKLSERWGVLAEAVMEADQQNGVGIDLERLLLQFAANDHFNVNFGRYHTAIGWYNTAYHHSTWLQTAVGRPFIFEFEDKGGILPIHNVGISANGKIPSGGLGLQYVAEIGNGRASRSPLDEPVQNVRDENNGKAANFAILARPDRWQGFEAGFSVYHDQLTPAGMLTIGQTIMAAHVIYQSSVFEWLNEGLIIRNARSDIDRITHTSSFYSQISRKFGVVRPYFRYQYINVPESEPLYRDVGLYYGPSLGVRYDFSEFAAFKIQYDRTDRRSTGGSNGVTTQLSFAF